MSGLRVIAGKARGHKLRPVPGEITRPITDRTKESLFNIIGQDIAGAALLDLFAGTGAVGIDALSRGADFVRFIDLNQPAIQTIRHNLEDTGKNNLPNAISYNGRFEIKYGDLPLNQKYVRTFEADPSPIGILKVNNILKLVLYKPGYKVTQKDLIINPDESQEIEIHLEEE